MINVAAGLGMIGTAYVVLTYLGSKLFPRAENIDATDARYQQPHL